MDLWIRSQDKEFLMKVDNINLGIDVDTNDLTRLFTFVGGAMTSFTLGVYETEERAKEVLDEIQNYMIKCSFKCKITKAENGLGEAIDFIPKPIIIYQMPKK